MYCEETFKFLIENKLSDSKEFFNENKEKYEQFVLSPLRETVERLTPAMLKIDPDFITEPKVDKTISRIYRDTRFSNDKTKYRDVMWITFQKNRKFFEGDCAYFFEISPRLIRYGIGYYEAGIKSMDILRGLIDDGHPGFKRALKAQTESVFSVEGEEYKKNRYHGKDENAAKWYNRKSMFLCRNTTDFAPLYSGEIIETLIHDFTSVKDVYAFFNEVEKFKKRGEGIETGIEP